MSERNVYLTRLSRLLFYLLLAYLAYLLLQQISGILSMLFVSLLTAYVLDPVVDWFERRRVNRTLAIVFLVVVLVACAAGFLFWIIPTLFTEFADAGDRLQMWLADDQTNLVEWVSSTLGIDLSEETMRQLKEKVRDYAPQALSYVGAFIQGAFARTMNVVGWLLNVVMVPVFVFYFLRDFDHMKSWVVDHLPLKHREFVIERAARVDRVVGDWIRGQVEVALIMAVLYAVGLWLVGVKLAVPIGILAGLLCVVPYLGFAFGLGLALLIAVLDWHGMGPVIGVVAVFTVVQLLEGYLLTPRIVGEKVGLSPVTVLIALLVGGELFGLLGFVLAVPIAGASKTIGIEAMDWYRNSEYYKGEGASIVSD